MRISVLIIVSLAANLVLAVLAFYKSAAGAPVGVSNASVPGESAAGGRQMTNSAAPDDNSSAAAIAARFSWRDLEVKDLKDYIRRLRAVGCPETTVQDLILAELQRRYNAKTRPLWAADFAQNSYWKPYHFHQDAATAKKNRDRSRVQQDALREKTAMIIELFGFDVERERLKEEGYDPDSNIDYAQGDVSFLSDAKREAIRKYLDDWQDKMQEFYTESDGSWGTEERAKQKSLEAEKMAGLAEFLTPDELREYELRNSPIAQQVTSDLHGVDITREQYEAIFDITKKYGDSIYNWGNDGNSPDQVKQIEQNQKDMKSEIAAAIGDQTAAQLERAQDYSYQQTKSFADRNDLSVDVANQIYDYKQSAEKADAALDANTDLTSDQRQTAKSQIAAETVQAVKTALGDKLFNAYKKGGGWWLNNFSTGK